MKLWSEEIFKEYYGITRKELARVIRNELYMSKEKKIISDLIEDITDGVMILPKRMHSTAYYKGKVINILI